MKWKNKMKRLASAAAAAMMLCGGLGVLPGELRTGVFSSITAHAATANDVLNAARSFEGETKYIVRDNQGNIKETYCLGFVQDAFEKAGISATRYPTATAAKNAWMTHTDRDIPVGAVVFFDSAEIGAVGHIEIYMGDNKIMGTGNLESVHEREFSDWYWARYSGWGWYNNEPIPPEPYIEAPDPVHYQNIQENTHCIINVGANKNMNYAWGISNPNPMWIDDADGSPEQKFTLDYMTDGKYLLRINHSDGGVVNCECATPNDVNAGVKLTGRSADNNDTQYFWITPVGNNEYVLQSGHDKNLVIGASSSAARSQLTIQRYTGSALQKWKFDPNVTVIVPGTPAIEPPAPTSDKTVDEGVYNLINCDSDLYMNYAWGISNPNPMWIDSSDGSPEQKFTLKYVSGGKYMLGINHSDGGVVNCECATPDDVKAGVKLTGRPADNNDTQYFFITPIENGQYVIQSGHDRNLVIGASSFAARSQLTIQRYTGSALQKWKLNLIEKTPEPVTTTEPVVTTTRPVTTSTSPVTTPEPVSTTTTTTAPEPVSENFDKGIDVSVFQGEIDWNAVAADGVKFAVIRSATTNLGSAEFIPDSKFEQNYAAAKAAGLKLGTYMYTCANSKAEMQSNINELLNTLGGKQFDMPVYLDIEQATRQSDLGKEALTEVISYGCSLLRAAGYQAGVYANKNWYTNYIDADKLRSEGVEIWMAAWPYSDKAADPADYDYSAECKVWQYSSSGSVSGISGRVDVDVRYGKFEEAPPQQITYGDVNDDGSVDLKDVTFMRRALAGWDVTINEKAADVNKDNSVDLKDVVTLRRYLAGGWGITL